MSDADIRAELAPEVEFDPRDRWANSRLNRLAAVAGERRLPTDVVIKDDTLRSGANTPGVNAGNADKLRLAHALAEAGVVEVEAGYPSMDDHVAFMRALKQEGLGLKLGAHAVLWADDIRTEVDRSGEAGADVVNWVGMVGRIPSRAIHPHLPREQVMERIGEAVAYAREQGFIVAIGTPADDPQLLFQAARTAADHGAHRIYLYDSRGCYLPETMRYLTRLLRDAVGDRCELAVHCHDDFGLATANSLAAILAGARYVDVTCNSTGHRCGNAAFEQVVLALEVLYGISTGIRLEKLYDLCKLVEEVYGVPIPANAPHVGATMYEYGGYHIGAILQGQWFLWENVRAETIGRTRELFFGPTSLSRGSASPVMMKIRQMGLEVDERGFEAVLARLRDHIHKHDAASEQEVESIIREVLAR